MYQGIDCGVAVQRRLILVVGELVDCEWSVLKVYV